MNKYFLFAGLVFFSIVGRAQDGGRPQIDSAQAALKKMVKEDTSRAALLNWLACTYNRVNSDSMKLYALQALQLSSKLNWESGITANYVALGIYYSDMGDFDQAIAYTEKALVLNQKMNNLGGISACYGNLGSYFVSKGDLQKALEYDFKAAKLLEQRGKITPLAKVLLNIGIVYAEMKDYNKELEYDFKSLKKFEEANHSMGVSFCYASIGSCYNSMGKYPEALQYHTKALKIAEDLGLNDNIRLLTENIGNDYFRLGECEKAIEYAFKALKMRQDAQEGDWEVGAAYCLIGDIYLKIAKDSTGRYFVRPGLNKEVPGTWPTGLIPSGKAACLQSAIANLEKGIAMIKVGNEYMIITAYGRSLAEAYSLSGRYREAYDTYTKNAAISDSVFTADNRLKLASLEIKREAELKEKQIEINGIQASQKKKERGFYLAGLGLLAVVTGTVARNFVKQKKSNRLLEAKKIKSNSLLVQKDELLGQKDMLMKEVHHRVKNNLQVISTLLDLQLENIEDARAHKAMTEGMSRIKSISLIHHQLYQNESVTSIEFSRFSKDLLGQVTSVFKKPGQTIGFTNEIPETQLDTDTAVPLGLILNELMTNSYKYAFPDGSDGNISIRLTVDNDNYQLTYMDSGPGLPAGYDMGRSSTLGMMVIDSLSRQLGGRFRYDRNNRQFIISFKDVTARKKVA